VLFADLLNNSQQARFRVYGNVTPVHPKYPGELFDMAHVYAGGRVVFTSDQHFGVGSNLILPGRGRFIVAVHSGCNSHSVGKDMSDGWETKRSRQPGHKDWAIIKLYVTRLSTSTHAS
jgi:allantoicase